MNAHIRPDFDTLHPCPWAGQLHKSPKQPVDPRVGAVLCDIYWPEGDPMQAYPRFVVKRLLQELEDRYKLRLFSAFEPEFRAFKLESMDRSCANPVNAPKEKSSDPPGDPEPFTSGEDMYKTGLLAQYESFFMDVDMKVREVGIDVQDYSNENAAGQLECPLMPKVGLQAADHYFLFKQALKEIGIQHNIGVSFMTTPMIEGLSSGCHYNHSLWNIESEANAFFDPKSKRCRVLLQVVVREFIKSVKMKAMVVVMLSSELETTSTFLCIYISLLITTQLEPCKLFCGNREHFAGIFVMSRKRVSLAKIYISRII